MIEIIKRETKEIVECNNCGAVLRYDEKDVEVRSIEPNFERCIICPQCNKVIGLEATR